MIIPNYCQILDTTPSYVAFIWQSHKLEHLGEMKSMDGLRAKAVYI